VDGRSEQAEAAAADAAARWLATSTSTHALRLDASGTVVEANAAALEQLTRSGDVVGRPLQNVASADAARVLSAADGDEVQVTFACGDVRYTLACRVFVAGRERWLVGERPSADAEVETELRRANNEMAVLARDYARQAVELREALEERDQTRSTLERIGEIIPVCMSCGALKTDAESWQSANAFLTENGITLSHGYCPTCGEKARVDAGLPPR
jgi:rubrerythrin